MTGISKKIFPVFLMLSFLLSLSVKVYAQDAAQPLEPEIPSQDSPPLTGPEAAAINVEEYLKELVLEPGASCITASCHGEMEKKKYVHAIGVDGMKCDRCHVLITEGKHRFKDIPPETATLCAQCHRADVIPPPELKKTPPKVISEDEAQELHEPFAEGKCTACHDAHSSDYYKHLKLPYPEGLYAPYKEGVYGACASDCHKDLEKKLAEPRTLSLTLFRNGNVNLHYRHVNKPKGRSCKVCHHPHGLEKPKLLKDTFLFGKRTLTIDYEKTESGGQCSTTCHRVAKYDRYKPEFNFIKTEPLPGKDATEDELKQSRKDDLERLKAKEKKGESVQQKDNEIMKTIQEDL